MSTIAPLDVWLPRIQTLMTGVSTTPAVFLDALTWYAFGDESNPLQLSSSLVLR